MNNRVPTKLNFEYGDYDDKLWDQDAKKDVYNKWDPSKPRSARNFNPFETFKGNSPDASGIYPGEVSLCCYQKLTLMFYLIKLTISWCQPSKSRYKDPQRGDASFAIMMAEKADAEERAANPKAGSEAGCAGCKS